MKTFYFHNLIISFLSLTISNALQFRSHPEELHVKLSMRMDNLWSPRYSNPTESHQSAGVDFSCVSLVNL